MNVTLLLLLSVALPFQDTAPPPAEAPQRAPQGLVHSDEAAYPGYTLYAPLKSKTTYLVDMQGEVVHEWESDLNPGNSVYLMDDGGLLRCAKVESDHFRGGGMGGRVRRLAADGEVLWELDWATETHHHHHDIEPLPNGNVLLIAWESISFDEAVALGRDPSQVSAAGLWPDMVVEIRPTLPEGGEIVWEWHSRDHLIQDFDPKAKGYGDVTAHPERIDINADHRDTPPMSAAERKRQEEMERRMRALGYVGDDEPEEEDDQEGEGRKPGDWMHTNSIDYHAELDLIALSVRTFNEVWVIDHSTTSEEAASSKGGRYGRGGDLLYRWGNPRMYGAGRAKDRQLFSQHDARWVGGADDLRLTFFNNGRGRGKEEYSSVDEIRLPFDAQSGFFRTEGQAFGPLAPHWTYVAPDKTSFYSSFISGAERLANGNTLICSGAQGRLFEVTPEGSVAWDYYNPHGEAEGGREGRPSRGEGRGRGQGPPEGRDGPPEGRRGPPEGRPEGPPPDGEGRGRGPRGGRRGGPGGGGPGGGMLPTGLFRAERIAPNHPGIAVLLR